MAFLERCLSSSGEQIFSKIEIVILYVNGLAWAGADALPAKEAFRHVIPYRNRNGLVVQQNVFVETFQGWVVLYKNVLWLAAVSQEFENRAWTIRSTCSIPVAFAIVNQGVGQLFTRKLGSGVHLSVRHLHLITLIENILKLLRLSTQR